MIIHSGVYSNAMAGGYGQIGTANDLRSTYMVFKGGAVIDSVGGSGVAKGKTDIMGGNDGATVYR